MTRSLTISHAPCVDALATAAALALSVFRFSFPMSASKMLKKKRDIYWKE
jgi:hypothetical protein